MGDHFFPHALSPVSRTFDREGAIDSQSVMRPRMTLLAPTRGCGSQDISRLGYDPPCGDATLAIAMAGDPAY